MSDAVDRYIRLADQFALRVEATPDDAWASPAPCEDWTARDVVGHVVGLQRRLTAAVIGGEAKPMGDDEEPKAAWRGAFAGLKVALADESALQKQVPSPMGDMPLEFVIGRLGATDVLVHTWDLARAVGGDENLDADAVAKAYEGLKPVDAMLRQPGAFGPKVDPPAGADLQTEFLCFLGRQP